MSGNLDKPAKLETLKSATSLRLDSFLSAVETQVSLDIEFRDVRASVELPMKGEDGQPLTKLILKGLSGKIEAGQLVALMGPSGAGKSTLLNALGGRFEGRYSGEVLLNGKPRTKQHKKYVGYVLQHDALLGKLTVSETLILTAKLRLPESMELERKQKRVDDLIAVMGLDKCKNTLVEQVSGGELKRTAIANELLMNPSVIYLDEPTSGLDSTTAYSIVSTLRQLTREGRTVICAIHQPSSQIFAMFDRLYLVSDGHCIYDGTTADCPSYLASIGHPCPEQYSVADFILELCTPDFETDNIGLADKKELADELLDKWNQFDHDRKNKKSDNNSTNDDENDDDVKSDKDEQRSLMVKPGDIEDDDTPKYPISWFEMFSLLYIRAFKVRRGNIFQKDVILQLLGAGFLSGLVYLRLDRKEENINDWMGAIFHIETFLSFNAMYRGIAYFPTEQAVIKRERQSGAYMVSSYYISKIMSEMVVDTVLPTMVSAMYYWMVGLGDSADGFFLFLLAAFLGIFTSNAFGTCLGCAWTNFNDALTCLVLCGVVFLVSAGFLIKERAIPFWFRWFPWISHIRWQFYLALFLVIGDIKFKCDDEGSFYCSEGQRRVKGREVLEEFGIDIQPVLAFVMLLVLGVWWNVWAYIFLRRRTASVAMQKLDEKDLVSEEEDNNKPTTDTKSE